MHQVQWSSIVTFAEFKFDLARNNSYEEALGQVSDRAQELFKQQPGRNHCVAAVLGWNSIEVLYIVRPGNTIERTGLLSFVLPEGPVATTPGALSPGMSLLARFLRSSSTQHFNYAPPAIPSGFIASLDSGQQQLLSNFRCLHAQRSPRGSSVFRAQLGAGPEEVVVKFSESIGREVRGGVPHAAGVDAFSYYSGWPQHLLRKHVSRGHLQIFTWLGADRCPEAATEPHPPASNITCAGRGQPGKLWPIHGIFALRQPPGQ